MDLESLRKWQESFSKSYWGKVPDIVDSNDRDYYNEIKEEWFEKSKCAGESEPHNTGLFWADLCNSDFTLTILLKSKLPGFDIANKGNIKDKIRFIKSIFEKGYEYFGWITHAHNYTPNYFASLDKEWYNPTLMAELNSKPYLRKGRTGTPLKKQWIIKNCPLFGLLTTDQRKFINSIRNDDSHDNTQIIDDEVYSIKDGKLSKYTEEIVDLFHRLVSLLHLSIHFYAELLVEKNFWIYPSIVLRFPEKYNYNKSNLDYTSVNEIVNRSQAKSKSEEIKTGAYAVDRVANFVMPLFEGYKDRRKPLIEENDKNLNDDEVEDIANEMALNVFMSLAYFSVIGIWERLLNCKDMINNLLKDKELYYNDHLIQTLFTNNLTQVKETFEVGIFKIAESLVHLGSQNDYSEIIESKGEKGICKTLLDNIIQDFEIIKDAKSPVVFFGFLSSTMIIILGFGNCLKNLDRIISDKHILEEE